MLPRQSMLAQRELGVPQVVQRDTTTQDIPATVRARQGLLGVSNGAGGIVLEPSRRREPGMRQPCTPLTGLPRPLRGRQGPLQSLLSGGGILALEGDQPSTNGRRRLDIQVARTLGKSQAVQVQPLDRFRLGARLREGGRKMERPCPDGLRRLHRQYVGGHAARPLPPAAHPPERQQRPDETAGQVRPPTPDSPVRRGPHVALLGIEQPQRF
jgi:hypothetical protein